MTLNILKWSLLTLNWIKSYKICFWCSSPKPKIVHPPHSESMPEKDFKMTAWTQCDQEKALYCFIVVPSILTILLPSYMHDVLGKWRKWFCCAKVHQMHHWSWCCFNPHLKVHFIRMCVSWETNPWAFFEQPCCTSYRNVNCFAHFYVIAWDFFFYISVEFDNSFWFSRHALHYEMFSGCICVWCAFSSTHLLLICISGRKSLTHFILPMQRETFDRARMS